MTRCSGTMTASHDGKDEREVRIGVPARSVTMCAACRDAAGRLGMIERREVAREARAAA